MNTNFSFANQSREKSKNNEISAISNYLNTLRAEIIRKIQEAENNGLYSIMIFYSQLPYYYYYYNNKRFEEGIEAIIIELQNHGYKVCNYTFNELHPWLSISWEE